MSYQSYFLEDDKFYYLSLQYCSDVLSGSWRMLTPFFFFNHKVLYSLKIWVMCQEGTWTSSRVPYPHVQSSNFVTIVLHNHHKSCHFLVPGGELMPGTMQLLVHVQNQHIFQISQAAADP